MFKLFRNIIAILAIQILFLGVAFPQSLNFHNYSTDDGLPQNSVFAIVQDSAGFIWFGTEAGVAKFDGVNFKKYDMSDGLVGSTVKALFIDSHGSIWVGTTSGLSIIFEDEIVNYTMKDGLPDDYIYAITEDNIGRIWIATRYGGACMFDGKNISVYNKKNDFPSNTLSTVIKDKRGNIWFASVDKGIIKYDGSMFYYFGKEQGLQSNDVLSIFEDKEGILWIGTDRGLSTFDGRNFINFSKEQGFPDKEVSVIQDDIYGNIWFGLYNDGIFRYDGQKVYRAKGTVSNSIRSVLKDKRGDLWFGTFAGGVNRLPADWFEIYTQKDGLANNRVFAIAEDNNNVMYFGHYGEGVSILNNDKFKKLTQGKNLTSNKLSSILVDSKNRKWFGTFYGITVHDKNKVFTITKQDGLVSNEVLKIYEDNLGYFWFCANGGVSKFDTVTNKVIVSFGKEQGFDDMWVNDVFEDKSGVFWFATERVGVKKYDGKKFTVVDTSNGLPVNSIFDIMKDKYGNLWFATEGGGICKFDGEKYININEKDGLSSNVCYFILEDNDNLYIGTVNGITILDNKLYQTEQKLKFKYISQSEGLPSKELNQGAFYKDSKGNLWFGTQEGIVKINPARKAIPEKPPVFLSEVKVSDGLNESSLTKLDNVKLENDHNNISFEFYSISFAKPGETTFEFKLEGIEKRWSETKKNSITYRALPPGSYKFLVRVKNSDGIIGDAKVLSTFTIEPPFYSTWWFITLGILVSLMFVYSIYYIKTQQVKKRNIVLREMVQQRTMELEKEKNKSDELLHNILPSSLVEELKQNGKVKPREFKNISIMFTDFKAFTYTTSVLPAEELVAELNDIFSKFDKIVEKYGLEKLKTIGDSYMAACGIPNEVKDHAIKIVYAALDFQKIIKERNKKAPIKWEMRLGIHSGSVVAGVVGSKKFTYDIWGDTVNIASRMESSGEPFEINISGYTYMLIRDYFDCEYRGKIQAKGKGSIDMYFVKNVNRLKVKKYSTASVSNKSLKQTT